ncbi:20038_t:CDS:10 [Cetraspora pellucida]|uniref:20038_t:CDS:1 n=1 Tax=Cetraspora pellucida TaxID=1433469 RepID=A0A9N9IRP8_9GLOM|nr:20038_t:CDS:10 [Cetraspora pellucida]
MAQGPMQALATQIAALVQQLQGDQDPITWLEDIEKAFDANMIPKNQKISVIVPKLREPVANWWLQVLHLILSLNSEHLNWKPNEMIRRVESGEHQYPNTAKAQMFINRLCPELYITVSPLTPNTNNLMHTAFMTQPIEYSTYLLQGMVGTPVAPQTNHNKTEEALLKLTEAINKIITQYQDQRRPYRQHLNSQNNNNNNPNPPVQQPPAHHEYCVIAEKKNVKGREDTVGLGETEEIPPQDANMDNRNEIEDIDDNVQEIIHKQKVIEKELSQISSLVPLYSIVTDIRDKLANITYRQLLRASRNMHHELARSLQKKRTVTRKKVQIDSQEALSFTPVKKLSIRIEHPSVVNMINIHEESKHAIGKISNFPFSVGGIEIPIVLSSLMQYLTVPLLDDNTEYNDNRLGKDCHKKEQIEEGQCIADLFDYCYKNGGQIPDRRIGNRLRAMIDPTPCRECRPLRPKSRRTRIYNLNLS